MCKLFKVVVQSREPKAHDHVTALLTDVSSFTFHSKLSLSVRPVGKDVLFVRSI